MRGITSFMAIAISIGAFVCSAEAEPFKDSEDRKTAAWILSAYGKIQGIDTTKLSTLKDLLARPEELSNTNNAFSKLQACRTVKRYKSNPLQLVAAEHYAYMRYEASKTGDIKLRGLPKKYNDTKIRLISEGKESRLQTTDWPVSPPSEGTVAWGTLGVDQGLDDFRKREKKEPTPGTEADGLERQMNLAASSPFFGWIGRTFGTPYTRTGNENCRVTEPDID